MVRTLRVELTITVNDDEQAAKIFEAVSNGMAEAAIKERVLYGMQTPSASIVQHSVDLAVKQREVSTKLVSHTKGTPAVAPKEISKQPKERARGVMGRGRLNRSGGGGTK